MKTLKGIRAKILKHNGESFDHLGRFSSRINEVTVVSSCDFEVDEIFSADESAPAVMILKRIVCNQPYLTAYPVTENGRPASRMFGGCFISASDSRITVISPYPIPLHDRME